MINSKTQKERVFQNKGFVDVMTTVEGSKDDIPDNPPADEEESDDEDEEENLIFTRFTKESWDNQLLHEKRAKEKEEENKKNQGEAHLVDGELHFDSEEHHGPQKTRNPALIEGNTLKEDSGFPKEIYGLAVEEFDKIIRENDKVRCSLNVDTLTLIMPNFLNGIIHLTFLTLSIIILRDIKMKT